VDGENHFPRTPILIAARSTGAGPANGEDAHIFPSLSAVFGLLIVAKQYWLAFCLAGGEYSRWFTLII